jgi:isopentenyldiphosphate isomerase
MSNDGEEYFDVCDSRGRPTGQRKPRALVHRDGDWHRCLHCWLAYAEPARGPVLLFQRRAAGKDTWPGKLDTTVAGHLRAGETLAEAMREVSEEIGLALSLDHVQYLGVRINVDDPVPGLHDREFQYVYFYRLSEPLPRFTLQAEEVEAVLAVATRDLRQLYAGVRPKLFARVVAAVPGARDGGPGAIRTLALDDFVPSLDRYFFRAALAIELALRGEEYVTI